MNEPVDGEVFLERKIVDFTTDLDFKKQVLEHYFLCNTLPDGRIEMNLLDMYDEVSDMTEFVELQEFRERFVLQPGYMAARPSREERQKQNLVNRICDQADAHYQAQEYNSAEYEYKRAVKLDENSVRANFGLALTYVAQGLMSKAKAIFSKLASLDAIYEDRHKHMFNTFGIQLRKLGMFYEALEHYNRALTIVQDDEHLWFNLARCLYEDDNKPAAQKMIIKALYLNPNFVEAQYFLQKYLEMPIPEDIFKMIQRTNQAKSVAQDLEGAKEIQRMLEE
jgi:tetratricopeptide (TPR) repeat protein